MKHPKLIRRFFAVLLALCLMAGLMPTAVFAAGDAAELGAHQILAQEIEGLNRLNSVEGDEREIAPAYNDDDIVIAIVQLEKEPVLASYQPIATIGANKLSTGEAISQYLASKSAKALADNLLKEQEAVLADIRTLNGPISTLSDSGVQVVSQWTNLINAMAVRVPYGQLKAIRALDGVKRAYVQRVYEVPTPMPGTGNGGYSYNMVGLETVWGKDYTGQGMVVAVLDTGLDLEWATYWDDAAGGNISAIRHTHEAFRENSFRNLDTVEDFARYDLDSMLDTLKSNSASLHAAQLSANAEEIMYKNLKVPFAYDYAGVVDPYTGEVLGGDVNVYPGPEGSDHGTHVAGTIAGYAKTEEGEVTFSGVAPDAQILMMKVFDDDGTGGSESAFINALEDAMVLGADVINMSYGSDNGFGFDDTASVDVYATLEEAGIILMTSAGNSEHSSLNNNRADYNLSSDPETSMMSSPAVYPSNVAVAAINSTVQSNSYLHWNDGADHAAAFSDPYSVALRYKFTDEVLGDEGIPIIPVGGVGEYGDYYAAGFRSYYGYGEMGVTGIALVKRGEISFADKITNAQSFSWTTYERGEYITGGVLAVLIYDSDANSTELINMSVDGTSLTSSFISGVDGAAIVEAVNSGKQVYLTKVEKEDRITEWAEAGQMSEFTSWGAGPSLELKPEITAPGGNIWSSIFDTTYNRGAGTYDDYVGAYGMMSGTSMAAPHMTGLAALVKQYVNTEHTDVSVADRDELTNQLLVSTALPQKQSEGVYYSPRQQGAGLVNVGAAVTTPAYISVADKLVGKLEFGDDKDWTGSFPYSFQIHNLTNSTLTYDAQIVIQRPATAKAGGYTFALDQDVVISTVKLDSIVVPASGTTVSGNITLTAAQIAEIQELFPNGTYIEGYIILTSNENPQIGLPFLGFLGDWTAAPIFDTATWLDTDVDEDGNESLWNTDPTWGVSVVGYYDGYSFYNLGQNIFDPTSADTQEIYLEENITLSPGSGVFAAINDFTLYQLRDAKLIVLEARDAETGDLYYRDINGYLTKSYYDSSYGFVIPWSAFYMPTDSVWEGTDLDGNALPSGTEVIFTITAYGDGEYPMTVAEDGKLHTDFDAIDPTDPGTEPTFNGHAMDKTGDVISFPVLVDTEAPKLKNSAVTCYEKDGRVYLTGTFTDDGSMANVAIYPQVARTYNTDNYPYGDPDYIEYGMDQNSPFYYELIWDADVGEWYFEADVTEYNHVDAYPGESYTYSFEWTGNVYIFGGDYGGNDRGYAAHVDTSEGLSVVPENGLLYVGDDFDLEVVDNTGSGLPLTFTSSDPNVAAVDEFGHVVALAPGQTTITITNGEDTVVCIVAVRERVTEVLDFQLSIDHFATMDAYGSLVVKVVNLEPANVELNEIRWEVSEDDETAENYEGLVNVARYTSDGLTGEIYLNYSVGTLPDGSPLPGGTGTLEVTLNGVTRTMTFEWADLYANYTDDGLISDTASRGEQTIYVEEGETATLTAMYRQTSQHSFIPVALYTLEGAFQYGSDNPTEPATGLVLDGPAFTGNGVEWRGKIVNTEGYALPESIEVGTRYGYGYEYWWSNGGYYSYYSYDNQTGEIVVYNAPYGADNTLVIRADGVEQPGNPAGALSGETWDTPEGLYGPFDWTFISGVEGELTTEEGVTLNNTEKNVAYFTADEPGVSFLRAASKDGKYSLDFAVITEPKTAESIDVAAETASGTALDGHNLEMEVGQTEQPIIVYDPEPTQDVDKELIWTSYNPEVATVDENGVITAVSSGYAYIHVMLANCDADALGEIGTYILVYVHAPEVVQHCVHFIADGAIVEVKYFDDGYVLTDADYPAVPEKAGYTGEWIKYTEPITGDITIEAVYTRIETDHTVTVAGDNNTWSPENGGGMTFRPDDSSAVIGVEVDGKALSEGDYIVNEDGTITLTEAFLKTLSEGEHTLTVFFADGGSASTTFTITKAAAVDPKPVPVPSIPQTGIGSAMVLCLAVTLAGAVCLAACGWLYLRKREKSKS